MRKLSLLARRLESRRLATRRLETRGLETRGLETRGLETSGLATVGLAIAVVGAAAWGGACMGARSDHGRHDNDDAWAGRRAGMVVSQLETRDIHDPAVLEAMRTVPRHLFVPASFRDTAYEDSPLPIGDGQTISQPYIVALMTQLLDLEPGQRVLEIGTGSGYQAAVLAELGLEVYTIEIKRRLCREAETVLEQTGYARVRVRCGDGYAGWPEQAPFHGIIVTAAPERVPEPLVEQLVVGGRMVIPIGRHLQELKVLTRTESGYDARSVIPVRFVPMTGEIDGG